MSDKIYLPIFFSILIFSIYAYLAQFGLYYFGDFGFTFTSYKFFASNQESVVISFANWINLLCGWLINCQFSEYGMKIFNVACAAVFAVNYLLVDKIIQLSFKKRYSFIVFLTSLFVITGSSNYINRYSLTGLFLNLMLFCMVSFFIKKDRIFIIMAALIASSLTFVRIPNITAAGIAIVFFIDDDIKNAFRNFFLFFFSWLAGTIVILSAIYFSDMWSSFSAGVNLLFSQASGSDNSHGILVLASTMSKDIFCALALGGPLALCGSLSYWIVGRPKLTNLQKWLILSGLTISAVAVSGAAHMYFAPRFYHRYYFTGFLLTGGSIIFAFAKSRKTRMTAAALIIASFVPMTGSNNGLTRNISGLWALIPFVLCQMFHSPSFVSELQIQKIIRKSAVVLVLIMGITMWSIRIAPALQMSLKQSTFDNVYFKKYGTPDEVKASTEELDAIRHFVSPGDYMITYQQSSTLYYLLDSIPFLYSPEPIFWEFRLPEMINKAVSSKKILPVVVKSPIELKIFGLTNAQKILDAFLDFYGYQSVWSNGRFTIYLPPQNSKNIQLKQFVIPEGFAY